MKIRLTKTGIPEAAVVESGTWSSHVPGRSNSASLPLGYWLEGFLVSPLVIGSPISVYRTNRNGVECDGIFRSSKVTRIESECVGTENSVYRIEYVEDPRTS